MEKQSRGTLKYILPMQHIVLGIEQSNQGGKWKMRKVIFDVDKEEWRKFHDKYLKNANGRLRELIHEDITKEE